MSARAGDVVAFRSRGAGLFVGFVAVIAIWFFAGYVHGITPAAPDAVAVAPVIDKPAGIHYAHAGDLARIGNALCINNQLLHDLHALPDNSYVFQCKDGAEFTDIVVNLR